MNYKFTYKNIRAILRIILQNFSDDPGHFVLLSSRRFSSVGKFNTIISILEKLCNSFFLSRLKVSKILLGEFAILKGEANLALQHVSGVSGKTAALVRARAYAFSGELSEAVRCAGSTQKNMSHFAHKTLGELDALRMDIPTSNHNECTVKRTRTVLHLITNSLPFTNSGYTQRTHSVLTSLVEAGWKPIPFSRLGYPLTVGRLPTSSAVSFGRIVYRLLLDSEGVLSTKDRILRQSQRIIEEINIEKPAVLHTTTDYTNGLSVAIAATETGLPWVYEVRGQLADTWLSISPDRLPSSEKYQLFKKQEAAVAKAATAVVTLGTTMKSELIRQGVPAERIIICPNAVGDEFLKLPPDRAVVRRQLGLEHDRVYVGTVSSLVSYEGLERLLEAGSKLRATNPNLRLLIVGDGAERSALIEKAASLGIGEICLFPGRVPKSDAYKYHRALDVFVVPRLDLSVTRAVTPLKPVEAMACEVPVVASDLPALREIVEDEQDGLLFDPNSVADLTTKLQRLINDVSLRERLGLAGRKKVLATRTWSANANQLINLYEELIHESK